MKYATRPALPSCIGTHFNRTTGYCHMNVYIGKAKAKVTVGAHNPKPASDLEWEMVKRGALVVMVDMFWRKLGAM